MLISESGPSSLGSDKHSSLLNKGATALSIMTFSIVTLNMCFKYKEKKLVSRINPILLLKVFGNNIIMVT
jgi:hypothetical protein